MRKYDNLKRNEREFIVGDLVYLRLQPYQQLSIAQHHNAKLAPRFYGSFPIEARVGIVAYRLKLPK